MGRFIVEIIVQSYRLSLTKNQLEFIVTQFKNALKGNESNERDIYNLSRSLIVQILPSGNIINYSNENITNEGGITQRTKE